MASCRAKKDWTSNLDLKKGSLRKTLKVKKGQKIPLSKLEKASMSNNPLTKKRAILAENFRKMHKS